MRIVLRNALTDELIIELFDNFDYEPTDDELNDILMNSPGLSDEVYDMLCDEAYYVSCEE